MNEEWKKLPTPSVMADLGVIQKNIEHMVSDAKKYHIRHRPHVKTHRCGELARMQIDGGCEGITVAKLGEAEVMADAGIRDILIAYPLIGEEKLGRLITLSKKVKVSTIINSKKGANELSCAFEQEGNKIDVLIEVDGGLNRGGIKAGKDVLEYARSVRHLRGIRIKGLMYYGGLVYDSRNVEEIRFFARKERDTLLECAELLKRDGFDMEILSAGSSFTGKVPEELSGITEIRSGHYIFNDCGQIDVGLVRPEDCALSVVASVVAKPDEHVVIVDVGTKTLTSDQCHHRKGYGYIMGYPQIEIYALNEEHAFLKSEDINPLQIGNKIQIIPNHACVVPNLAGQIYGFRNGKFDHVLKIDAQGKSV